MTAEGINHIGIIPTLINTGELRKGTILFLDEPDNNLNPVAITEFVNVLNLLAKAGVQIFLTTHNFFIIKRLHLAAKTNSDILYNIFSLKEDNLNKIEVETSNLNISLPDYNPIVDQSIKIFNDYLELEINS